MKQTIRLNEAQFNRIVKETVRRVLKETRKKRVNEMMGWGSEPEDFIIVPGKLEPNKMYVLIKISNSNGIYSMFVTEYKSYYPAMLNDIKEWADKHWGKNKMFVC